ncbi:MAG: biotin--[acetyl-CoA-carboxylase] ligase [Alphaproteobacteria bacterium HGW-Alphaproteobacteria-2]|nr:MAG: biotin--[acetyl-CoA-carboxylase] ligase [Alphaproteobacteria bacterium HGW-Alphaproteobacteria-2]
MPDWSSGTERLILESVDSTMAEAARRAVAGAAGPLWIMAREQVAARGRRGRVWENPVGNFAATLLMRPPESPVQAGLRSFTAALALYDALAGLSGRADLLTLKWPNDVLLAGGKVAGILLESAGQGGAMSHLAIGFGVNLAAAPPPEALEAGAFAPVSVLEATGVRVAPEVLLDALAAAFDGWEQRLAAYGFAPVRRAWLARAARLGETITARMARETLTGIFETVDETGALVLSTRDGRRVIPAADVFF